MDLDHLKFGLNVFNYPPEDFIQYSTQHSLRHIEINLTQSHSSLDSFDDQRISQLCIETKENNIDLSLHLPNHINIADNIKKLSKSSISYLHKTLDLAERLNVKYINCHMGFFFWFPVARWQRDKALERFSKNIKDILRICETKNIILAVENVTPLPEGSDHLLLGDNIQDFDFLFSNSSSPNLKMCLDTGHANLAEGVVEYITKFKEQIISVHYHDNNGNDDSHLEVGKGNINWDSVRDKLLSNDFKGPLISECRNLKPHEAAERFMNFTRY